MNIENIKEFLENRKILLLKELKTISSNFEEMDLNDGFDYPFNVSFDELISELSDESDYKEIKEIHSKMIERLEEVLEE
jgi:hypothetical protein